MAQIAAPAVLVYPSRAEQTIGQTEAPDPRTQRRAQGLLRTARILVRVVLPIGLALSVIGLICLVVGGPAAMLMLTGSALFLLSMLGSAFAARRFAPLNNAVGFPVPEESHLQVSQAAIQFGVTARAVQSARQSRGSTEPDEVDGRIRAMMPQIFLLDQRYFAALQKLRTSWVAGDEAAWHSHTAEVIKLGEEIKTLRKSAFEPGQPE